MVADGELIQLGEEIESEWQLRLVRRQEHELLVDGARCRNSLKEPGLLLNVAVEQRRRLRATDNGGRGVRS